MRCPDCNKFVSYSGDEEPEEQSSECSDSGDVQIDTRLAKTCAECGTELKESTFTLEETLDDVAEHMEHAVRRWLVAVQAGEIEGSITIETETEEEARRLAVAPGAAIKWDGEVSPEAESTSQVVCVEEDESHELEVTVDSAEQTERTEGKGRGLKTFYGVRVEYTVKCSCGESWSGVLEDELSASGFEEC